MRSDLARRLGYRVSSLRRAQGITQEDFVLRSGIPIAFIRRVERGEVKNPSLERLSQIAAALGVPVSDLFVIYEKSKDGDDAKGMLIDDIARMLRLHGLPEVRAVKVILREVFAIQRLGRK